MAIAHWGAERRKREKKSSLSISESIRTPRKRHTDKNDVTDPEREREPEREPEREREGGRGIAPKQTGKWTGKWSREDAKKGSTWKKGKPFRDPES